MRSGENKLVPGSSVDRKGASSGGQVEASGLKEQIDRVESRTRVVTTTGKRKPRSESEENAYPIRMSEIQLPQKI